MKRSSKELDYSEAADETALYAKALAHPARIVILKHLSSQDCCYTGDLLQVLPLAQSTISQHLKELKDAGLIQGEVHLPKVKYCIHPQNWQKARRYFDELFKENFGEISCC
jgi:predicted transcriptional regulator